MILNGSLSLIHSPKHRIEQKRILTMFKAIQLRRLEREKMERDHEELLTRRLTVSTSLDHDSSSVLKSPDAYQTKSNHSDACLVDMAAQTNGSSLHSSSTQLVNGKLGSSGSSSSSNLLKVQKKPLVKRVRTRYLNLSTDAFGLAKMLSLRVANWDWLLILVLFALTMLAMIVLIVWQTSPQTLLPLDK